MIVKDTAVPIINFQCATCGKSIDMDAEFAGRSGRCPQCQSPFVVPLMGVVTLSNKLDNSSTKTAVAVQFPVDGLATEPKRKPPFLNRRTQLILGLASAIILGFIGIAFVGSYFGYWDSPDSKQLSIDELQQKVFQSIQTEFPAKGIQAIPNSLVLVHEQGNIYSGVLSCTSDGAPINIKVKVTYDGNGFVWETAP
jgi:hypothetical protein